MEYDLSSKKIGIVVGLEREKRLIPKYPNFFVENGYGKKAYIASQKILKKKIDVLISFGFAKSVDSKIKNSNIVIPEKIFNEKGLFLNTSKDYNKIFRKKITSQIWKKNLLTVTKILKGKEKRISNNIGVVDMESFFAHKAANEKKIPFTSIKIIFDDTNFDIPDFIIDSLDENGEIKFIHLIKQVFKNPLRIKKLFLMTIKYQKSKSTLGEVLKKLIL